MQTRANSESFPGGEGVDVAGLERELTAMWAEAAAAEAGAGGRGVVRACVMNLVVYAGGRGDRAGVDALLGEIIERHPCRAIVLAASPDAPEARLEAYVSARCQLSKKGAKQVCGEQITIEAAGPPVRTLDTAVAPLLVPDVPVFLWWRDIPHFEDKLFSRLLGMADRLVTDTASSDRPREDLLRLAQLIGERPGALKLGDLNWERLATWRTLVASFWDVEEYRPSLGRVARVEVEYDPQERAPGDISARALLAVGWLASRLGWRAEAPAAGAPAATFAFRAGERLVEVSLRRTPRGEGQGGMLSSLKLGTADGCEFYAGLMPGGTRLETSALTCAGERFVGRVLNYEARSEGERLSSELDILGRDTVYEEAVSAAAGMLRAAAGGGGRARN